MAGRDIVVVGASAGGVEALVALVNRLPADLPSAVFVVLHVPPFATSRLPEILTRSGPLPARHARTGDRIEAGRVYVAPPDHHLLIRPGYVELSRGPRENRTRPAVDPLFRSAALAYGPRVAGVLLSGALDDGAMGLQAVRARGGLAIVQDPDEARVSGMPLSALSMGGIGYVLPVAEIAGLLQTQAQAQPRAAAAREVGSMAEQPNEDRGRELVRQDLAAQAADRRHNTTATYSCPECGGTLWEVDEHGASQFRCHVGHTYAPTLLLEEKSEDLEAALWTCVRLLTEKATLSRQLATRLDDAGDATHAERIREQAELDERHQALIKGLLIEAWPAPTAQAREVRATMEAGTTAPPPDPPAG